MLCVCCSFSLWGEGRESHNLIPIVDAWMMDQQKTKWSGNKAQTFDLFLQQQKNSLKCKKNVKDNWPKHTHHLLRMRCLAIWQSMKVVARGSIHQHVEKKLRPNFTLFFMHNKISIVSATSSLEKRDWPSALHTNDATPKNLWFFNYFWNISTSEAFSMFLLLSNCAFSLTV